MIWITTPEDLVPVAKKILQKLSLPPSGATCLALSGDLGTGKTTLTQYLADALGVTERLPSPTFLIMRRYTTPHPIFSDLVHIDAYRLESSRELLRLSWKDMLTEQGTLVVVEWAERVLDVIPADAQWIRMAHSSSTVRTLDAPWLEE